MGISPTMAIVMRSQMEMRNMLLHNGGKAILPSEMKPPLLWTGKASSLQFQNQRAAAGAVPSQARGPDRCPRVSGSGEPCPSGPGGQSFESKKIILGSGPVWGPSLLPSWLCLSFGMEGSVLCLSHHCISKAHNLLDFKGSRLERNLP